jgi:tetratricopeptide (TPR) repeat protein
MAYFEMGKFSEAEMWLNRARSADKTMVASEYNLGRIAFETGRYEEAAVLFEKIIDMDPENVMALKAAAFSRIKNGDLEMAEALYDKVLLLAPENADDGFNYALVLYGLEKYEESEEVLNKYPFALEEKAPSILLLARTQRAMEKIEAIDTYAKWVDVNAGTANPQGLYEYAQVLEEAEFYAKALEQYEEALKDYTKDTATLKKSMLLFGKARILLAVDPDNEESLDEFNKSIKEGFADLKAIEPLISDERITQYNREEIRKVYDNLKAKIEEKEEEETEEETETSGEES